jgi:hypothetical protein
MPILVFGSSLDASVDASVDVSVDAWVYIAPNVISLMLRSIPNWIYR